MDVRLAKANHGLRSERLDWSYFRTGVRLPPPPPDYLPSIDKKNFIGGWFYFALKSRNSGALEGFGVWFLMDVTIKMCRYSGNKSEFIEGSQSYSNVKLMKGEFLWTI